MTRSRFRDRNRRRGSTVVETAIVANLLFMILLGVFEYGRIAMIRELMDEAAREGARLAVVSTSTYPTTTTQQIIDTTCKYMAGQSVSNLNIQVYAADSLTGAPIGSWDQAPFGAMIAVQIDADYPPMIPVTFGILPNPLHMTAKSVMRSEAN
jgi:Flp pilus assembly protein TadG